MENPEGNRPAFDEQAALAELERLREHIVALRSKREAKGEEFDRFVRSLKATRSVSDLVPANVDAKPVDTAPPAVAIDLDAKSSEPAPPAETVPDTPPAVPAVSRPVSPKSLVLVGGALLLLAAAGIVTWTLRKGARESTAPDPIVSAQPPPKAEPAAPPAAAPPAPASTPASPYESRITTSRPVWVRIVADGQRVLERELPAAAIVPFKATRDVVIRAGDAGALRLSIGGKDQGPLGPDGVVVTRTFSVPGPSVQ